MPLMNFTKLTGKVRNHSKKQTMRLPRKRTIKVDDLLHIYTSEKLGTARVKSINPTKLRDISIIDAISDGFETIEECQKTLMKMHKCTLDEEFDIIKFEPNFKATMILKMPKIFTEVFE